MRQIQKGGSERQLVPPAIPNDLFPHDTTAVYCVKEVETEREITRERTYIIVRPRPVCPHCGEAKERIVGSIWACCNAECPGHDPKGGAAIPLPAEGKTIIDVDPVEKRRAA